MIFISPWQQAMLGNSDHWYLDGTFFVVPNGSYQLINIAIYDNLSDIYIPLVWALTSHKTYDLYINLFWDIAKLLPAMKKLRITVDFEQKLSEALKVIFECDICGCYYHFSECIQKKAKKLGLLSGDREKETQEVIKNLKSLVFTSSENFDNKCKQILNQYNQASQQLDNNSKGYHQGMLGKIFINTL